MEAEFKAIKVLAQPNWDMLRRVVEHLLNEHGNSESRNFAALFNEINIGRVPVDELHLAVCLNGREIPGVAVRSRLVQWCRTQIEDIESVSGSTALTS